MDGNGAASRDTAVPLIVILLAAAHELLRGQLLAVLPHKPGEPDRKDLRSLWRSFEKGVDIAVPIEIFDAWWNFSRGATVLLPQLMWPEDTRPMRWFDDDEAHVVFLQPDVARRIIQLVGGSEQLVPDVHNGHYSLVRTEDGTPEYVHARVYDDTRNMFLGFWALPVELTIHDALHNLLGRQPNEITDQHDNDDNHDNDVDAQQSCGDWHNGGGYELHVRT